MPSGSGKGGAKNGKEAAKLVRSGSNRHAGQQCACIEELWDVTVQHLAATQPSPTASHSALSPFRLDSCVRMSIELPGEKLPTSKNSLQ